MHLLGNLRPQDASHLTSHLLYLEGKGESPSITQGPQTKTMWEHFRGAFGRTTAEQVDMYEWHTGKKDQETIKDDRQTTSEFSPLKLLFRLVTFFRS